MGTGGIDGLTVWAQFRDDGSFELEGVHRGAGAHVGREDYEYFIKVAPEHLPALATALGCAVDGILEAWSAQQDDIVRHGERRWLEEHGVTSSLYVV